MYESVSDPNPHPSDEIVIFTCVFLEKTNLNLADRPKKLNETACQNYKRIIRMRIRVGNALIQLAGCAEPVRSMKAVFSDLGEMDFQKKSPKIEKSQFSA